jgi:hypothetical protein
MKRASGMYDVDDLLLAYRNHIGRPLYGLEAYREWNREVLAAVSRAFGVSFFDDSETLRSLRTVLEADAALPHPTGTALDDSLFNLRYPEEANALADAARALGSLYERVARELALAAWGELGTRTDADLAAAGLDFTREPKLEDHVDEI